MSEIATFLALKIDLLLGAVLLLVLAKSAGAVRYLPNGTVGIVEAGATKAKVDAFGGPECQLAQQVFEKFADAIKAGGVPIVPQIQVGSDRDTTGAGGTLVDALLAMVMRAQRIMPKARAAANGQALEGPTHRS